MASRNIDGLLPQHHAEQANKGDYRRRWRADLDEAIGTPTPSPISSDARYPVSVAISLFLWPQDHPAGSAGRDLAIGFLRLAEAVRSRFNVSTPTSRLSL